MAAGIRIKFAGVTQDEYDAANERINPEGDPPAGLIFHASGTIHETFPAS